MPVVTRGQGRGRRRFAAILLAACSASSAADAATGRPTASQPAIRPMSDLKIAATIPIGHSSDWVAITPESVWIGSTGPNAVNEIDLRSNRVVATVALPGRPCAGIAVDASHLWVPLCGPTPKLAKIDFRKRAIDRVVDIGPVAGEQGVAVGAGSVWLITDKEGTLARIDPATGSVVKTIQLPAGSYNPVFSDGFLWVSRVEDAELTMVDPAKSSVVKRIAVGPHPRFLAAGAGAIWTLNQGDGTLSRVDVAMRRPTITIPLNTPGPGGDVAFEGGRVWTTMMKTPLTAIDAATSTVLCQWQGEGGDSLRIGHGSIWLTNLKAGTVSRVVLADLPKDCSPARPRR